MGRMRMMGALLGAVLAMAAAQGVVDRTTAEEVPNLEGAWRLDPGLSQDPEPPSFRPGGERGGPGGGMRRGGMGRARPEGVDPTGPDSLRLMPARMPPYLRIKETDGRLILRDSLGFCVGEIRTGKSRAGAEEVTLGVPRYSGKWKKDGRLEARQTNANGPEMTRTFRLMDDGKILEVTTKVEHGDMPAREFVRVYQRVPSS